MPDHDDNPTTPPHPPGGVPDQLIDPDVEPVEPDPLDAAILADMAHDREVVGRVASDLLMGACEGLIKVLKEHTDHPPKVLLLCQPPSKEGPLLTPSSLKRLNEYLGPRYRVVETAPIEPTAGGPPLGRPPPLDSVTGAPMTAMEVRETIEYLRQAKVDEDGELCRARMSWTSVLGRAANARRVLLWLLDGKLPVTEPCEHDETFASADDISRWCTRCGALCVDGEWRLPGHPAPAT